MTENRPLAAVLGATGPVLLDFDGPVTALLPAGPNAALAQAARQVLYDKGIRVPTAVEATTDHLAVLRFAGSTRVPSAVLDAVESACIGGEVEAARLSALTPGARDALNAFHEAHRPVVIVSNNAPEAIATFLTRHGLDTQISGAVGRVPAHPELMKPHPHLVRRALEILAVDARQCVLVGDSVTDIEVGLGAKVRTIGYAKTPERGEHLADAGADAIVATMSELATATKDDAAGRA